MIRGKIRYLNRLYSRFNFKPAGYGKNISGASPPSVFVGRKNYPKVYAGPLIPQSHGDTQMMDFPERWLEKQPSDVINFRMQLVRGKQRTDVNDTESRLVAMLREVTLSKKSVEMEASFRKEPRGIFFNEETQPFGPSAPLEKIEIESAKFERHMEKAYCDTDMLARDAVVYLYRSGVPVSSVQKAFSTASFGIRRKLVPTRWSITAVDDALAMHLLEKVKEYPKIDSYRVYEFKSYNNFFAILLLPTGWQYEFLEAFIRVMGSEEVMFSDWEPFRGRKEYASIGGCYYSTKLAVAEKLEEMKKQAGAIVFRESYPGYTPLGVWLVRECARAALSSVPKEFSDLSSSMKYVSSRLWLPEWKYRKQSVLMKQKMLLEF